MSKLYAMAEYRRKTRPVHFTRAELNRLLGLYGRRVAAGEWRDYAIDQRADCAAFAVFRRAHEPPLYIIGKHAVAGRSHRFVVTAGDRKLREAQTLDEVLAVFEPPLRLVTPR